MQRVCVLGATGSIGGSTLDVCGRHPDRFDVVALTANRDVDGLFALCQQHGPQLAVMAEPESAKKLQTMIRNAGLAVEVMHGESGLVAAASMAEADTVMAAIVGAAGLAPSLAAAAAGKRLLLANKESLVMSGDIFMQTVRDSGATLLPIDSEHNAIFQCLPASGLFASGSTQAGVRKILLTASGGPFRTTPIEQLQDVSPDQACAHPNWSMGRKISVDSATLMNKGLELIEATLLFDVTADQIEVVVHPQSVIHSMVDYLDGSVLAQLGNPDMRTPIAHALAWPDRIESGVGVLDLLEIATLNFEAPDTARFPCLRLAKEAAATGGAAPCVLNAANEVAVAAFLEQKIGFLQIADVVDETLGAVADSIGHQTLEEVLDADRSARLIAKTAVQQFAALR